VPLKLVHANRSPALAPVSVLKDTDTRRIGLDVDRAMRHLERIKAAADLAEKVRQVHARRSDNGPPEPLDAELAIYRGFCGDGDRRLCAQVRRTPATELTRAFAFRDPRCSELLLRYRARNHPETLDAAERQRWDEWRRTRLTTAALGGLTLDAYFAEIDIQRANTQLSGAQRTLLDQLEQWGRELGATL
jgi:exodeoxyribonuclease-1